MSSSPDPIDDADPTSRPTLPDSLLPPDEGELAAPQAPDSEQTPQSRRTTLGPFRCLRDESPA